MLEKKFVSPDYLFEVSWEVCNKVGGIHTVIATKALNLSKELQNNHILIGPDVWRDTEKNPEFIEEKNLLKGWRAKAAMEGLRIRVGRWNVSGTPVVILVDFSIYLPKKDEIFTEFWTRYGVDSISGSWDYIESSLFGYAAGKVIESFVKFNLAAHQKAVAQFHEWMTGAGILYLKSTPLPVATVFTTHATVVGRAIAGNNQPLYDEINSYNPEEKAREFNVISKHSLEKVAANAADIFTTVSGITSAECTRFLGREPDLVTPNGFENSFTPKESEFKICSKTALKRMTLIASVMTGCKINEDALMIGIGGRYEFKNKGIDIFLDALGELAKSKDLRREIVAWIFVPAGHNGPDRNLVNKIENGGEYTTLTSHTLSHPEWDPILKKAGELQLFNKEGDKIKLLFIPSYLNGNDGIFNLTYYQLLCGLDMTSFPIILRTVGIYSA
jgi:glycogen phosphorylase/synthase